MDLLKVFANKTTPTFFGENSGVIIQKKDCDAKFSVFSILVPNCPFSFLGANCPFAFLVPNFPVPNCPTAFYLSHESISIVSE